MKIYIHAHKFGTDKARLVVGDYNMEPLDSEKSTYVLIKEADLDVIDLESVDIEKIIAHKRREKLEARKLDLEAELNEVAKKLGGCDE